MAVFGTKGRGVRGVMQPIMQAMLNCVCVYVPLETVLKASQHRHCSTGAATALSVFLYVKVAIFIGSTVRLGKMAADPRRCDFAWF